MLPDFILEGDYFRLVNYNLVDDKLRFQYLLNRYRNIFRESFGDSSAVSVESTVEYLRVVEKDLRDRRLYAIYFEDSLIGQYGLRVFEGKYILLDNALRFLPNGPRKLFADVGRFLVSELLALNLNPFIFTAIRSDNINAFRIHSYGNYQELGPEFRTSLRFDSGLVCSRFLSFI